MTVYLPVVRREGSISALRAAAVRRLRSETRLRAQRPLLAALRQRQPIGQPAPKASPFWGEAVTAGD